VRRQNEKLGFSLRKSVPVALWLLLSNIAHATEATPTRLTAAGFEPMATGKLLQMGLGLFLVLGLILATAWLARRIGRIQGASGGALRIIGGLSMGARERVVLVQVGDTQLLLGVAPGRIQTLHVLPEAAAIELPEQGAGASFATSLSTVLNKRYRA
jgi:flagellar protein FliO/FliZ